MKWAMCRVIKIKVYGMVELPNQCNEKEAKIFRQMEDSYDLDDSEVEFRQELVERERLMKEEAKNQKIQSVNIH
jgi:hypothetical protein